MLKNYVCLDLWRILNLHKFTIIWVSNSFVFQQFGQLVQYVFEFLTEPSKVKIAKINSLPTG